MLGCSENYSIFRLKLLIALVEAKEPWTNIPYSAYDIKKNGAVTLLSGVPCSGVRELIYIEYQDYAGRSPKMIRISAR